jgi:CubicO group peptidase (beta-lactamase class C family)
MLRYRRSPSALFVAVMAFGALGAGPVARAVAAPGPALEAVDAVLEGYVERGEVAGAVALVWQEGRLVHERAYGRRSLAGPDEMRVDDIFRIASMTKPVVAVGALILVDRGLLSLDDPIERYLPEFRAPRIYVSPERTIPARGAITVRQLLAHTSGLGGTFEGGAVEELYAAPGGLDRSSPQALVASLARHPLVAEPGTRWIYSYSYEVVGRLLEVLSGKPLDVFLRDEIFRPLGMEATGFSVAPEAVSSLAGVQRWDGHALSALELHEDPTERPALLSASGGLYSTVGDYLRFARMLLDGGVLEGRRIVSERAIREMTSDQLGAISAIAVGRLPLPGQRFGLGVALIEDCQAARYEGGVGAFYWPGSLNTIFFVDPEWRTILLLFTQYTPFLGLPIETDYRAAVFRSLVRPEGAGAR